MFIIKGNFRLGELRMACDPVENENALENRLSSAQGEGRRPAFQRLRLEDHKVKACLGDIVIPCLELTNS